MSAPIPDEIKAEIAELERLLPDVREYDAFGLNNREKMRLQIEVLKGETDEENLQDIEEESYELAENGWDALRWMEGDFDEKPSEGCAPLYVEPVAEEPKKKACAKAKPCEGCPWRRMALPGWLGAATPEQFVAQGTSTMRMPCHLKVNYERADWEERAESGPQCRGAAIFRANIEKTLPKGILSLPADTETVFGTAAAFLAHHRSKL